ncbi:ribonuclease HII [Enterovirga rhinocerotis]|uniref:Ribonuclease HII n=1 Tax=Enterovirga rhinocerotis TaxID=1339210 RepID=A0A4R7C6B0_9HYPH|nr:ribonuclease HII [Enterovirga rhinocerotis]TDR93781.1 RNase HII [Enterovirga rhinocerotis]
MPLPILKPTRERKLIRCGKGLVAGLDEVGRGPLAGPVVAAAVVLDMRRIPKGLGDSKAIAAERREELYGEILRCASVGIAAVPAWEIDRINIRQASLQAMCRALAALPCRPDAALVDGNDPPPLPCDVEAVIKGDASVPSIAAASIVAKVVRDRLMKRLALQFPAYGFTTNVGYSTAAHLAALRHEGPCPHHRRSFAPVRLAEAMQEKSAA